MNAYKWLAVGIFAGILLRRQSGGVGAIEKTRYRPPYNAAGKATFPGTRNRPGVYLVKEAGNIVYVGHSQSDLYKTMYRHFQSWQDPTQYRATYPKTGPSVRVVLTTAAQAPRLEAALIRKHRPRDNQQKMERLFSHRDDAPQLQQYQEADPF